MIFRRKLKKDIKNFSIAKLPCFNVGQGFSLANVWKSFSLAGAMLLFFSLFTTYCLLSTTNTHAFEPGFPKLVWEKEYPFRIDSLKMANESGDVLIQDKANGQLILIDPQGYEKLHLGPDLKRSTMYASISANGEKILYANSVLNSKRENPEMILSLINRNGKEIWNKKTYKYAEISPNADFYYEEDTELTEFELFDINNKKIWEKSIQMEGDGGSCSFTSDNNAILVKINFDCFSYDTTEVRICRTYSLQGKLINENRFKMKEFSDEPGISKLTDEGYLVWIYKENRKIYNYSGNAVLEIPINVEKAFISFDSKIVLFQYKDKFEILNVSDKKVIIEDNLNFFNVKLTNEGKYLIGMRKPTNDIPENIIVYDIQNKSIYKVKIGKSFESSRWIDWMDKDDYPIASVTNNGKYLLIIEPKKIFNKEMKRSTSTKHLYYYQLY